MDNETIPKKGYSFRIAYDNLPSAKQPEFRTELMKGLGIKKSMLYRRINGYTNPSEAEQIFIRQLFVRYGIDKPFDYENID